MFVPEDIRTRIANDVKRYVDIAAKHFARKYAVPAIRYDVRGTTAGYAEGWSAVRFNPVLLMENVEDFIARTVPHEVAHVINSANLWYTHRDAVRAVKEVNEWFGHAEERLEAAQTRSRRGKRSVHGPEWQHIMHLFGVRDVSRCHSYDVKNAQVKTKRKFEYKCAGCNHSVFVSSVLHNRMARGQVRWHKPCGRYSGQLVYVQGLGQRTWTEAKAVAAERSKQREQQAPVTAYEILQPRAEPQGNVVLAKAIMAKYGNDLTRQQFIVRAVDAGMKATTASTYYNNLRRKT